MQSASAEQERAALAECTRAFASQLRPPRRIRPSQWAGRHRILVPPSPRPGQWRNELFPYLVEIMDRLGPEDACESCAWMKCIQTGATEVALNLIGHTVDVDPSSILYVLPTVDDARRFSRLRLAPLLEHCPTLKGKVGAVKSREGTNNTLEKTFPGGYLRVAGANSASGLQMDSIRILVLDEVDNMPADVDGQGDPVDMAIGRTTAYESNRKILMISKATRKASSRILKAFLEGDQRYYFVPCPGCGEMQRLEWERLTWPEGKPAQAFYVCAVNGCAMEEHHKDAMFRDGEWRATAPFDGRHHSYHLSGLYAPLGFMTWASMAIEFEKVRRDPVRLKKFVTERLGQPWEDDFLKQRDHEQFIDRLEDYGPTATMPKRAWCPAGVEVLTVGTDVQGDRIEYEVKGWGAELESWTIDFGSLFGRTDDAASDVWRDLDDILRRKWTHELYPQGLQIVGTGVDSGYSTDAVYSFTNRRTHRRVWAIKGMADERRPIWPEAPSTSKSDKRSKVYPVGQFQAKQHLYDRLFKCVSPGPGYMHFKLACDKAYFEQLLAEQLVEEIHDGRRVRFWKVVGTRRNEVLDRHVYAYAALHGYAQARGMTPEQVIERAAAFNAEQARVLSQPKRASPAALRPAPAPTQDFLAGISDWWR